MSVLACSRKGCESIMCDNYSHRYGCLCCSCKQELKDKGDMSIEEFMDSEKQEDNSSENWDDFVDSTFKTSY